MQSVLDIIAADSSKIIAALVPDPDGDYRGRVSIYKLIEVLKVARRVALFLWRE